MAPTNFNQKLIDEFRQNGGRVGGPFQGATVVLLHHQGRKSGTERVNPLVYQPVGEGWAIFASKAGAPDHPDWYQNLMAHPDTTAEIGTETIPVRAREATGAERDTIWKKQKVDMPGFAEYEEKAAPREIPVVVLERR
jgi:deazaflavin-dependent oxidoreductase (nitroreductase family)